MIIVKANDGEYIEYTTKTKKVILGDDEISLNLEKFERDDAYHIDVCRDTSKNLVMGVIPGIAEAYVAQIDIPPREYDYVADGTDDEGNPRELKQALPLDMAKCTLTLWAIN